MNSVTNWPMVWKRVRQSSNIPITGHTLIGLESYCFVWLFKRESWTMRFQWQKSQLMRERHGMFRERLEVTWHATKKVDLMWLKKPSKRKKTCVCTSLPRRSKSVLRVCWCDAALIMFTKLPPESRHTSDVDGSVRSSTPLKLTLWCFRELCEDIWLDVIWLRKECEIISCRSIRAWRTFGKWKILCFLAMSQIQNWSSSRHHTLWRRFSCSVESLINTWLRT